MPSPKDSFFGVDSKQSAHPYDEPTLGTDGAMGHDYRDMAGPSRELPPAYTEHDPQSHAAAAGPPMLPQRNTAPLFYMPHTISRSSTAAESTMAPPALPHRTATMSPLVPPLPQRSTSTRSMPVSISPSNTPGPTLAPSSTHITDAWSTVLDGTEIELRSPKELLATHVFDFSRPIFIHSTLESKANLTIIADTELANQDSVRVAAHLVGKSSGIQDRVNVAVQVNKSGEFDFWVSTSGTFWSKPPQCQITVYMPPTVVRPHPGIRAETPCGRIEMTAVSNIDFEYLRLYSNLCEISLSNITCRSALLVTGSAKIDVSNSKITDVLKAHTVADTLAFENLAAGTIFAITTKGAVSMTNITAGSITAETSSSNIKTQNVNAGTAFFKTNGATIDVNGIKANSLRIATSDSRIEGKWTVRDMLDVSTTKRRIEGSVELTEPHLPVKMRFSTTDARINVTLPGNSFRGIVDARTVDSSVSVEVKKKKLRVVPELHKLVDDKPYKRVMVGSGVHDFAATTTNSKIDIKLA
ncbi:hypothetical protein DL89DRAFT_258013 [Linderina pennispora]|uniref:DUF4097 domain-containing protein n=1 Tax=Linderina pennispora TaxID=61395 RepID=A0A1Y1W8C9_9FUNG|nr:uncharacterized protein DL89DRAFT_258013 [Linderina pennispora]ORX69800.1 hypothetical protein DL89DRAFT_258013 [Linderina pennispora]